MEGRWDERGGRSREDETKGGERRRGRPDWVGRIGSVYEGNGERGAEGCVIGPLGLVSP